MTYPFPILVGSGSFVRAGLSVSISPSIPEVLEGDRLYLFIVNNSTLGEEYTISGEVDDWDEEIILNVSSQTPNAYLYTRTADGTETDKLVTLTTTPRSGFFHCAIIFRFTNASLSASPDYRTTPTHKFIINSLVCTNEPVTTTGDNQLALNFIADRGNDYAFGDYEGTTGGNWEEVFWSGPAGGPPVIGLQIAEMPSVGTIDDGFKDVGVGRNYRIIGFALKPKLDDAAAVAELSSENCGTVWLVLITIDHPDLSEPIRITPDGISVTSNGNLFTAYPVQIILPDDTEGRIPQAQITIDNTTREIVAALRGLSTPPTVTLQIVRSEDLDIIEREWVGLKWVSTTFDPSAITGVLTVDDISKEEFPYITFDGRFSGLFP